MSQFYEIMTILSPNESEEGVDAIIGGLRQQLTTSGGEILAVDVWGKRKLAYPINKFEEGTYVLIHAEGPANMVAEFRHHTSLRESVLRELVVKLEGPHAAAVREQLADKGPEDAALAEAQIEAAEQRAADKLAEVTAPVTDVAATGVEVVAAAELEDAPETDDTDAEGIEDRTASADDAAEAVTAEIATDEIAAADASGDDAGATADSDAGEAAEGDAADAADAAGADSGDEEE